MSREKRHNEPSDDELDDFEGGLDELGDTFDDGDDDDDGDVDELDFEDDEEFDDDLDMGDDDDDSQP